MVYSLILLHISYAGLGSLLLLLTYEAADSRGLLFWIASYFLGAGVHICALYLFLPFSPVPHDAVWLLTGLGALSFLAVAFRSTPKKLNIPRVSLLEGLLLLSLLPPLTRMILLLLFVPEMSYDAVAIWGSKANLLFYGEYLQSEAFTEAARIHAHPGYPLAFPLFLFEQLVIGGDSAEQIWRQGLLIFNLAALGFLYTAVARMTTRQTALLVIGILLYTPALTSHEFMGSLLTGYADAPLALFLAAGAGFSIIFLSSFQARDLFSAMLGLTFAVLWKNEGAALLVLFYLFFLPALISARTNISLSKAAIILMPLLTLGFQRLIHHPLPSGSDLVFPTPSELAALPSVLGDALPLLWGEVVNLHHWKLLLLGIGSTYIVGILSRPSEAVFLYGLYVGGHLLLILAVLCLSGIQLDKLSYYAESTLPRLTLQLVPAALVISIGFFRGALQKEGRT